MRNEKLVIIDAIITHAENSKENNFFFEGISIDERKAELN